DAAAVKKIRTAAKNRIAAAGFAGQEDRAAVWEGMAASTDAEEVFSLAVLFARSHFSVDLDLLLSIPHVGEVLAVQFIATLFPLSRFEEDVNGEDRTVGNIRKYLRWSPRRIQTGVTKDSTRRDKAPAHSLVGALYLAGMQAASRPESSAFARRIVARKERGVKPGHAVVRAADSLLRCCVAVLRSRKMYVDPDGVESLVRTVLVKSEIPCHLVPRIETAEFFGVTRSRVGQLIFSGALDSEEWEGVRYVFRSALVDRKEGVPLWSKSASLPESLVSQSTAARILGLTRGRVSQLAIAGLIEAEEWEGKRYLLRASVEAERLKREESKKDE
ncbi:hypothetical protein, partial [Armatimonas sp.]|uniref:hypothetical protein n=1 Tax=Armatimonas sp. TaxID=1872638 RepID=UPI003750B5DD